jgi:hypothetical protein
MNLSIYHLKWSCSTSETKFPNPYQAGGTCSLVAGSLATRVLSVGSGHLGRWSHITITGRSRIITIITAYCPPIHSIESAGPQTDYFRQYHQLRQCGVFSPEPLKRFHYDLTATVHELIHKRHELVIMLDSNDALSDSSPTHLFTTDCGLFSVHEHANYAACMFLRDLSYNTQHAVELWRLGTNLQLMIACVREAYQVLFGIETEEWDCQFFDIAKSLFKRCKIL